MKNNKNKVELYGEIMDIQPDRFFKDGERFKRFYIGSKRISENVDLLPVIVKEEYMSRLKVGQRVYVEGKYISFNKHENGNSHLILEIKAEYVLPTFRENDADKIVLEGYICKPPVYRKTLKERELCELIVAYDLHRSDYIPCIAWWNEAREAANFKVGDFVKIVGRIQSRVYQKKLSGDEVELRTAYEESIGRIIEHEIGSKKDHTGKLQEVSE